MRVDLYPRLSTYSIGRTCQIRPYSSQLASDPLRILFCGSDEFSIASLRALYKEHERDKALIQSIDVVCRPPKPVGRGYKDTRQVPISLAAKELALSLHEIDTFTRWKPPLPHGLPVNLIVAVSFGLFVPPRILEGARYGGLNVHPSILPDFHGPAPLHHTLLSGCQRSGVTVQTLHPKHFDQGTILAQTPNPGFEHGCSTVQELLTLMSSKGAKMLVHSIRDRLYLQPAKGSNTFQSDRTTATARPAPKITSKDKFIDWNTWTAEVIIRRHLAIGPLWSFVKPAQNVRRLIWSTGFALSEEVAINPNLPVGRLVVFEKEDHIDGHQAYVRTCDNRILRVDRIKIEGDVESPPLRAVKKAGMVEPKTHQNAPLTCILLSTEPLADD